MRRSSNVDEVDLAILLKKDKMILLVTKFIITTITAIDNMIRPVAIGFDRYELIP